MTASDFSQGAPGEATQWDASDVTFITVSDQSGDISHTDANQRLVPQVSDEQSSAIEGNSCTNKGPAFRGYQVLEINDTRSAAEEGVAQALMAVHEGGELQHPAGDVQELPPPQGERLVTPLAEFTAPKVRVDSDTRAHIRV